MDREQLQVHHCTGGRSFEQSTKFHFDQIDVEGHWVDPLLTSLTRRYSGGATQWQKLGDFKKPDPANAQKLY